MKFKISFLLIFSLLSIITAKSQPPKLCNIQGVLVERTEPKKTSQISQPTNDKLRFDPNYFKPMASITVEAKRNEDGTVFSTKTDKEGNYSFKNLTDGIYVVSPILTKDHEKGVYYATVGKEDCIETNDIFEIHTVGNIKGNIENLPRYAGGAATVSLSPVSSEKIYTYHQNGLYIRNLLNSKNCKTLPAEPSKPNSIAFDCIGLPTGKYYLSIFWKEASINPIYYPGVGSKERRSGKKLEIIEIKAGQTTDASFKLPDRY